MLQRKGEGRSYLAICRQSAGFSGDSSSIHAPQEARSSGETWATIQLAPGRVQRIIMLQSHALFWAQTKTMYSIDIMTINWPSPTNNNAAILCPFSKDYSIDIDKLPLVTLPG